MKLDASTLEKAIGQFEKSLAYLRSPMAMKDKDLRDQFRAAAIQGFEFTYEISMKMLRRQLDQMLANPSEIREISFMDFIRTAYDAGLVRDVSPFKIYRDKRNITSHTYDADKAEEIVSITDDFLTDTKFILAEIKKRNA